MLPIIGVPTTIQQGMAQYRDLFCRDEGFEHVGRYVTGLILSPHKTLQGMYDAQVWQAGPKPSRRAMHAAVFEAGWDADAVMRRHRAEVARDHRGHGRAVLSWDWTYAQHDRGPQIWGVKKRWDQVEGRYALYQTVGTAVMANRALLDGVDVVVQQPDVQEEEAADWRETVQESYTQMEEARGRLLAQTSPKHPLHQCGNKLTVFRTVCLYAVCMSSKSHNC